MKPFRIPFFVLLMLSTPAFALTLSEALSSVPARTVVVTAQLELADAEAALARTQSDPLALRPDLVNAQQRVDLARAEYARAYYDSVLEIAGAYGNVLQAREQLALAQQGVSLAEQSLDIARIRLERGSATELDVQDAQVSLEDAQNNLRSAQAGLDLAENNLAGILGREVEADALEPIPDTFFVEVPPLDAALAAAHPNVLEVSQPRELAELNVDLLDPAYSARSQIDTAQTQADTAREFETETLRGFRLQVRNLYTSVENAAEAYRVQQEALANADERLSFQRQRLDSGLIPEVQFRQAELENAQTALQTLNARHAYLNALLELQSGTLLELPGPEVLGVEEGGADAPVEATGASAQEGADAQEGAGDAESVD